MSFVKKKKNFEQIVCPVCKQVVHEDDLPDKDSIILDFLYYKSGIRIFDSDVKMHCQFEHMHDGEGNVLDDSHGVIGIIRTHFNDTGKCDSFEIVEIVKGD